MATILIIDDDRQMRRLLIRILEGAGHRVLEASDGRAGMALFQRQNSALVITDLVMPDMEGIETIQALRRESQTLPILAISGGSDPIYLRAAIELGASSALEKPFAADALIAVVARLLSAAEPSG